MTFLTQCSGPSSLQGLAGLSFHVSIPKQHPYRTIVLHWNNMFDKFDSTPSVKPHKGQVGKGQQPAVLSRANASTLDDSWKGARDVDYLPFYSFFFYQSHTIFVSSGNVADSVRLPTFSVGDQWKNLYLICCWQRCAKDFCTKDFC